MRGWLCGLVIAMGVTFTGVAWAQPAVSRGEQIFSINYQDCMARARAAFQSQGWVNIGEGGSYVNAFKGESGAYITCNESPAGRTIVNIFVASNSPNSGAERVALQSAMNSSPPPPIAAGPAPIAGRSFTWMDNGRSNGVIQFAANGTATIDWYEQYRNQVWRIDGCCALIVSTLDGAYITRLTWDPQQGAYVGVRDASSRVQDGVRTIMRPQ